MMKYGEDIGVTSQTLNKLILHVNIEFLGSSSEKILRSGLGLPKIAVYLIPDACHEHKKDSVHMLSICHF